VNNAKAGVKLIIQKTGMYRSITNKNTLNNNSWTGIVNQDFTGVNLRLSKELKKTGVLNRQLNKVQVKLIN